MGKASDDEPSNWMMPVERLDQAEKLGRASNLGKNLEEDIATHEVERFGYIDKSNIEGLPLLTALFLQLSQREDHINCGTLGSKAVLRLWENCVSQLL